MQCEPFLFSFYLSITTIIQRIEKTKKQDKKLFIKQEGLNSHGERDASIIRD